MKKLFLMLVVSTLIMCTADHKESEIVNVDLTKDIQQKLNIDPIYLHSVIKGEYQASITDDDELIFIRKTEDKYLLNILQSDNKLSGIDNIKKGEYEVLYLPGIMILKNSETNALSKIFIQNETNAKILKDLDELDLVFQNEFEGYGLIYTEIESDKIAMDVTEILEQSSILNTLAEVFHDDGDHLKGGCPSGSSGGDGSTSCSNANCSVSCSSGRYACCNKVCSCIAYIETED